MDWKKIAPWNWFKEEESSLPMAPETTTPYAAPFPGTISALREEMDRLFEGTLQNSLVSTPWPAWIQQRHAALPLRPRVDISEGKKAYKVEVDLPGVRLEDILLEVDGQTLVIRAETKAEREETDEHYHYVERTRGVVQRVLSLPDDADVESIDANFKNGVLKLKIPKRPDRVSSGRNVEIHSG